MDISDYCKECQFLCKTNKEYCPNRLTPYEGRKLNDLIWLNKMKSLDSAVKTNINSDYKKQE